MTEKAKKKDETDGGRGADGGAPLEKLILNRQIGKYLVVDRISYWAKQLRKLEEHRHLTQTEVLELAMADVLGGKVDEAELDKKLAAEAPDGASSASEEPKKKA